MHPSAKFNPPALGPKEIDGIVESFELDMASRKERSGDYRKGSGMLNRPTCLICQSPQRRAINKELLVLRDPKRVAELYSLPSSKMNYHGRFHLQTLIDGDVPPILVEKKFDNPSASLEWNQARKFPWKSSPEQQFNWVIGQYLTLKKRGTELRNDKNKVVRPFNAELVFKALDHIRDTVALMAKTQKPPAQKSGKKAKDETKEAPKQESTFTPEVEKELALAAERRAAKGRKGYGIGELDRPRAGTPAGRVGPEKSALPDGEQAPGDQPGERIAGAT